MKIRISDGLSLPLEAITNTFAIFGIRGSGKSNLGAVMAEGIIKAGQPVCIIDPTGAWHGLKSSRDGKSPGLPVYVFGGEYADIPLEPTAGEVLANFVVERRVPTVLDLKLMRKHEQIKFVMTFAETLFHRNREPLMVMIDEVARFAPQMIKDRSPEAARCLGGIEDLATLGRNRGLGVTLIAQRPAPVSTTLRTQVENLICLRTIGKHDRKALDEWVEAKGSEVERDQMMRDLAELPDGVGYFWSPGWLHIFKKLQFLQRETFDSGATPKIGQKQIVPKAFAEVDKTALSAEIKATIERVKAEDPKELRRELAELKKQLSQKQPVALDPDAIAKARTAGAESVKRELAREMKAFEVAWGKLIPGVVSAINGALVSLGKLSEEVGAVKLPAMPSLDGITIEAAKAPTSTRYTPRPHSAPTPREVKVQSTGTGNVSKAGRKVLTALAQFGVCPDTKVGALTGYAAGAGHFSNTLSDLRSNGFIAGDRSNLQITNAGLDALGAFEELPSGKELQQYWFARLPSASAKILSVLCEEYPKSVSDEKVAELTGYAAKAGHFSNSLSELRTRDLILGDRKALKASEDLF